MRFSIHYKTGYRYSRPVTDNLNALRVRPATTPTQACDDFHLRVDPETRLGVYRDYFGTEVIEFGVSAPHTALNVEARARVATSGAPEPPEAGWSALESRSYQDAAGEYLLPSGEEADRAELTELRSLIRATSPLATLKLLTELIPDRFEYRPGATYVSSTVEHLLDVGAGVCQDFVHLALVLLRGQGIAARYVSGYLFAAPNGESGSLEVDTHAWLEALMPGPGGGGEPVWVGADPTNRGLTGEQHVKIGHGRHYSDVPPIKGVYRGTTDAELDVSVTMTRVDS